MARSQNTFIKRQREQARREKAAAKIEKRQQRKNDKAAGVADDDIFDAPVSEQELTPTK